MLTAGFGEGHHKVAQALSERFAQRGVEPIILDCYRSNHPKMADLGEWVYDWTTRYTPLLYGASYHLTADFGPDHRLWRALSSMSKRRLVERLNEVQADIILQLFPDHVLAGQTSLKPAPFIGTVLTDYSVHGRWFHKNVDRYFIPDERISHAVRPFISDASKCIVTGIPLRQQFFSCALTGGAPTEPYILVATGGRGVFPELKAALQVLQAGWPTHKVYVMCGRNAQMKSAVDALGHGIHGVPYVDEIATWLQRADVAVVKSGGITVAECLAAGTPMLMYRPQPGQETGNARFAQRIGAAKVARDLSTLEQAVLAMGKPDTLAHMQSTCSSGAHIDAADRVVETCLQYI